MADLQRLLLLCSDLENTGPTYNTLALSRAFGQLGLKALSVARCGGERVTAFEMDALPCRVEPWLGLPLLGRPALRRLAEFSPQVIHAMDHSQAFLGRRLAKALQIPLVVTINRALEEGTTGPWQDPTLRFVAVSDDVLTRTVQRQRVTRGAIEVIHNGIDLDRYTDPSGRTEAAGRSDHSVPVIGTFGSLASHKGHDTLLRAAAIILKKHPSVEFVILGRGPELSRLRLLAEELGVTRRVTFSRGRSLTAGPGDSFGGRLETMFLRDFDVFVEPSTNEGLGLSVLQAMAWSRPVVASGVGGLYSLVEDGKTGLLVQKGDPDAMAKAILELIEDPKRAREMGMQGRERIVADFNIEKVAGEHLELYRKCLGGIE
ncbi:MAG: glycosyltransferase family 4 protein [Planctomycetota bacterium]|jgi:glycosyltransferase involved in cell wall biosynthesis